MPTERFPSLVLGLGLFAAAGTTHAQVTWVNVSPIVNPSGSQSPCMTWDTRRQVALLVTAGTTWTWDGVAWSRATVTTAPPARDSASLAFDDVRGRAVLFGGVLSSGTLLNDTWEWDGTNWALLQPAVSPPPQQSASFAWHAASGRMVLFGGYANTQLLGDFWSWDGTSWTQLNANPSPGARAFAATAYDPLRGVIVLDGGTGGPTTTWEWNGTVWAFRATTLPARSSHASAFDAQRGTVVLFASGLGLTMEWTGSTWLPLASRTTPPPRDLVAMASHPTRGEPLAFGGNNRFDTWSFATDCRRVAAGHTSGSLPLICQTSPLLGQRLCVEHASQQGFGMLMVGPGPCATPIANVDAPLFCAPGSVYAQPWVLLTSNRDPALMCLDIPFDLSYLGLRACLQGMALQPGNCLRLTDVDETQVRLR